MQLHVNLKNLTIAVIIFSVLYLIILLIRIDNRLPDVNIDLRDIISYSVLAVVIAGRAVVDVSKEENLFVEVKGQITGGKNELLTKADQVSNFLILNTFGRLPGIALITEESQSSMSEADVQKYRSESYDIWLGFKSLVDEIPLRNCKLSKLAVWIDPLDATQEFIEGLHEYNTVMICIAYEGRPIFGIIYRPFLSEGVFGLTEWGVANLNGDRWNQEIIKNVSKKVLISRSHAGDSGSLAKEAFNSDYIIERAGGSGYKVLKLLNASAEVYVHATTIKKWDICAGDALLQAAGGMMLDLEGSGFDYSASSDHLIKKGLIASIKSPYTYYQKLKRIIDKH